MKKSLQVLIVEDSEDEAERIARTLRVPDRELVFERVQTGDTLRDALLRQPWDAVIADDAVPHLGIRDVSALLRAHDGVTPFIVVSDAADEQAAAAAREAGAHEFVMKNRIERLRPVVEGRMRAAGQTNDSRLRYPAKQLAVALVFTTLLAVWLGWNATSLRDVIDSIESRFLRFEQLRAQIVHLDEVLTMSARMAAATGDPKWEARYRQFEPQLDDAIKETVRLSLEPAQASPSAQTDAANHKLVEMELRAFALAKDGKRAEAAALLASPDYEVQQGIYANGMTQMIEAVHHQLGLFRAAQRRQAAWTLTGAAVAAALAVGAWAAVITRLRLWRRKTERVLADSVEAHRQVSRARDELELRVRERTAPLTAEIAMRQRVEQALRESDERLRQMLDALPVAAYTCDAEGLITYFNKTAVEAWGRAPKLNDTTDRFCGSFRLWRADGTAVPHDQCWMAVALKEKRPVLAHEIIVERPDGSRRIVLAHANPLLDSSGRLAGAVNVLVDLTVRKQAEEALAASETRLRAILQTVPECVKLLAADGTVLKMNPAGLAMIEAGSAEEVIGQNITQLILPAYRQKFMEMTRRVFTGEPGELEFEVVGLKGARRWMAMSATPLRDADGGIIAALSVTRDTTERRRAEEALRESQQRFEQLAGHINEVFWITDPTKDQLHYVSPAYETIWGRTCASLYASPRDWLEAIHPDDRARVLHAATTRQAEGSYDEEYRIVRPDGALRWIRDQAFPVRDAAGQVHRIVGMARDITERKLTVLALRESQHLLEQAQQVAHIGSWVSDPSPTGRLNWSAESARIFGFAPGEFDGRVETFFSLVHPEDREAVTRASAAALAGTVAYELEHRIVRGDGQTRWVHEQANVERDAAGQPVQMVGVVQDITERKQLEEQLRRAQKMEAIGQLAGGIAHDFNNILGAILGNAELIQLVPAGGPQSAECLDSILAASHRAKDLVRQILAFSRRQEQRRQPMQLHHVVKEALTLMRASVPAAIEFRASLPATPTVLADPSEIHQVAMNLCTNAWHAMKERPGLLTVELAETDVSEAFARLHPDLRPGRYARLTVADTGCGMDAATLQRIFEPFFTTKPVGEGTGLGLAVVHGIVKNHDGGVVVRSESGRGTTFALYFPVFAAEVLPPTAELQPIPAGAGEHVLFVDDEEPLTKLGQVALEMLGYRVTPQTSAADALALFRAQPDAFDLVVTDQNMPGMSGVALGQQMLALRPEQRLMLTTGYSASINAESVRTLGFRELLPKPYDLRALGEAVRRVLGETKATSHD